MVHVLEELLHSIVPIVILILELIGIFIIILGVVSATVNFAKHKFDFRENKTKILLGESFALALEFMLGAEIISTVTVKNFDDVAVLGVIMILRVALTFVLHWEIHQAELADEFNIKPKDNHK